MHPKTNFIGHMGSVLRNCLLCACLRTISSVSQIYVNVIVTGGITSYTSVKLYDYIYILLSGKCIVSHKLYTDGLPDHNRGEVL